MPIETAPKDGTRVLLAFPCAQEGRVRIECGHWDHDRFATRPKPYWTGDQETIYGRRFYRERSPAFWMPLPASPTEKK